jgi:hypothetical protein
MTEYVKLVRAFEVSDLSPTTYAEREVHRRLVLRPGSEGWDASGMHYVNAHQIDSAYWIVCVNG